MTKDIVLPLVNFGKVRKDKKNKLTTKLCYNRVKNIEMGLSFMLEKYIKITSGVLKMKKLNSNEKLLYGLLVSLQHQTGQIYAKNDFLAESLGLSQDTIKRCLKTLKTYNMIKITSSNRYRTIEIVKPERPSVKVVHDPKWDEVIMRIFNKR